MRAAVLLVALLLASPARPGCGHRGHHDAARASAGDAPRPTATTYEMSLADAGVLGEHPGDHLEPAPIGPPAIVREGTALALSREGDKLYVACEELRAIHVVYLPDAEHDRVRDHPLPMQGAPANVVVLTDGRVLATIRDPGLVLAFRPDPVLGLVETARVPVAADAWGLAVSPDEATAYVTSAWTHTVTAVDVAAAHARWTADVAREPRGVLVHPSGPVYVSHLTSAPLTRIDVGKDGAPQVRRVALPPSPLRAPRNGDIDASLGYSLALSPDGGRMYVPRHALGALGDPAWFGAATVDVLLVPQDRPLAPPRAAKLVEKHFEPPPPPPGAPPPSAGDVPFVFPIEPPIDPGTGPIPMASPAPFSQPRSAVYLRGGDALLLAGEGDRWITRVDALAPDPAMQVLETRGYEQATPCFGPSGLAVSGDESVAYVYCRATLDVRAVSLKGADKTPWVHWLGLDPGGKEMAEGRRLFYNARRTELGEDVACSGCHPEGRDDGHVWHEAGRLRFVGAGDAGTKVAPIFVGGSGNGETKGVPRQTPMLAGRLGSPGPYGWRGESKDVAERILVGSELHRWSGSGLRSLKGGSRMAEVLARFVTTQLVPPPRVERTLTEAQARGRALFQRADVGCASCHTAADDAPALVVKLAKLPLRDGFDDEDVELKVPSLRFVGGTPPYLHEGSAATLVDLVEHNGDRMGHTAQLSPEDRAALAAYLETL